MTTLGSEINWATGRVTCSEFLERIKDYDKAQQSFLLLIYAPWCGFCRMVHPEFTKAHSQRQDQILSIDSTSQEENAPLTEYFKISGYPTLIKLRKIGNKQWQWEQYEGDRSAKAFIEILV
jgi:thiol-disulfide isomerase/thioredoxin